MKYEPVVLPADGFVRFRQIRQVLPMARATWYDGVRNGMYPPSYNLGNNMTAWLAADVHETIAQIKRGEKPHWPANKAGAPAPKENA